MYYFHREQLAVRALTEEDAPLLVKWLSDPEVLQYYEGRDNAHDLDMVKQNYYDDEEEIYPCIVQYENVNIGYIQFYPIAETERIKYDYAATQEAIYGMDQFIGETAYWNRGIGTLLVSGMRDYIISLGVNRIVMDPQTWNHRALRCYEKCGFVRKKLLPKNEWHEGEMRDCWLIEYQNIEKK